MHATPPPGWKRQLAEGFGVIPALGGKADPFGLGERSDSDGSGATGDGGVGHSGAGGDAGGGSD